MCWCVVVLVVVGEVLVYVIGDGFFEVGVVEYDVGWFVVEFLSDVFDCVGWSDGDGVIGVGWVGEWYYVDVWVSGYCCVYFGVFVVD